MKKILFALFAILLWAGSMQAQNEGATIRKGLAFGVDKDTLGYLIASPYDNWYLSVGGGVQTLIGSEPESANRFNKANLLGYAELGKWLIPDLSISLAFRYYGLDAQSIYSRNPWIDYDNYCQTSDYQHYHTQGIVLNGNVTFDWTNFLHGYENGGARKFHVMTKVGLGYARLFAKQTNPRYTDGEVGKMGHNQELDATGGVLLQYAITPTIDIDFNANWFIARHTLDWSYNMDGKRIFDQIPSATIGVRFNLLKYAYRGNAKTRERERYEVNHRFLPVLPPIDTKPYNDKIEQLLSQMDSLSNLINKMGDVNDEDSPCAELRHELDSLKDVKAEVQQKLADAANSTNAMQELIYVADALGLPIVTVYYELDKYYLDYNAQKNLQHFAHELESSGTDLTYYIIGAADEQTGSVKRNDFLSEQRCLSVYNKLVKELGVDPDQLVMKPLGGIREFEPQELNRVGIVVPQHYEVTKIIDKWAKIKACLK